MSVTMRGGLSLTAGLAALTTITSIFWSSGAPLWIGWRVYTEQILVAALAMAMAIAYLMKQGRWPVASKVLAANQGLYNGFLAAGLVWGLVAPSGGTAIMTFFLCCVFVAGVFGALTVNSRIFYVQAAPATLGLALLLL